MQNIICMVLSIAHHRSVRLYYREQHTHQEEVWL